MSSKLLTLALVILFIVLMTTFYFRNRKREGRFLRDIPAFYRLQGAIEVAVEDGTRIHIAIGRNDITSPQGAAALVGLSMLKRIALIASDSDHPPMATAGAGTLGILAQDTIRSTYQTLNILPNYDHSLGRVAGLTPFSYAAGAMSVIFDEDVSVNLLAGSFGNEAALITSAGERSQTLTLAGTDNIPGQAILYATAHEPLIGEELYAGGAYIDAGPMHVSSLQAQDVVRWVLVLFIIGSAIAGLMSALF
jgi:hypothetical protein